MRRRTVAIIAVALLVATSCEGVVRYNLDALRAGAGVAVAETRVNSYLDEVAQERAAARCVGDVPVSPEIGYGGETAAAVAELTGVAPLDPAITNPDEREYRATETLWNQWRDDPTLVDPDLTVGAVATIDCGNDTLSGVVMLRQEPTMPAEGRFAADLYTNAQLVEHTDLVYATAVSHGGQIVDLKLDVYTPPDDGPAARPAVLLFHGGGFTSGDKNNRTNDAKAYARRGFVGITASYRLRTLPVDVVAAATDAVDDGQEAVRWLKANADTYGIDTDRIAVAGTSSGGAVALGVATVEDPSPAGPLSEHDPDVAAVISTGAHLTPGLAAIEFDAADAPVLDFYHELDGEGWEYAHQTCAAMHTGGSTCDFVVQPGAGHTTSISPSGPWWTAEIGPFLWHHLSLDAVEGPTRTEPFHMPTMLDSSSLDAVVLEDWHIDADTGTTRQKLIEIHVDQWWDGVELRVPVRLITPLDGGATGFVITGEGDPVAGDHIPTSAEQRALDGGVGVVRTKIRPIQQYPGFPSPAQLGQRFLADLDVRYTEPWMWSAILMRSITAAFADGAIAPGPVLAWGGSKNGATPLISSIHDDRITGVYAKVAPTTYSPIRGHQPVAVAAVDESDADFDAARAAGLAPGDQPWPYYEQAYRSDLAQAARAAGWGEHDLRALMNAIGDDVYISESWERLRARGLEVFSAPGSHDWVAYDVPTTGDVLPDLRQYIRPNAGHGRPGHPQSPADTRADDVFFAHHLFGAAAGLEAPEVTTQIVGSTLNVTVVFPDGGVPEDSRVFWMYDRAPDGSSWYLYDLFPEDNWDTMTGSGSTRTVSIPLEPGHQAIDVLTTHTISIDGQSAPISAPYTRVQL
ncbi:MAG: alpha/beta hydrolase [Acidimicrobiia bacterium]|nr:alpha/beta hydrolase [Acidimicrobiia bacterium]